MALKILEAFRKTQEKSSFDYGHSELLLYQNMVIQESASVNSCALEDALEHLDKYASQICDKLSVQETIGKIYLQLNRHKEAREVYEGLLDRNPENTFYYQQLLEASQLDKVEDKVELFHKYQEKFPRALAPRRLPLNFTSGSVLIFFLNDYQFLFR